MSELDDEVPEEAKYCWEIEVEKEDLSKKLAQGMLNMLTKKRSGGFEDFSSLFTKSEIAFNKFVDDFDNKAS